MFVKSLTSCLWFFLASAGAAFACNPQHQIVRGDTLMDIASAEMGTVWAYPQIHEENRDVIGRNPDLIRVGDTLDIPCLTGVLGEIDWSVMPTAAVLDDLMDRVDIQVIDIRPAKKAAGGVIPGAINIPFKNWRSGGSNPGAPLAAQDYAELFGENGVRLDVPTIVVHSQNNPMSTGASAYVYWVLKSLGAEQLAILRGGYPAWVEGNYTVDAAPATAQPYVMTAAFSSDWHATHNEVWNIAQGDTAGLLLDARPHKMFNRVDDLGQAIASTIPGASNLPASPLMSALAGEFDIRDGVQTVIAHYDTVDASSIDGDIVTFCSSGELAALNWFYASELAAIDGVKLYPDSLKGWQENIGVLGVGAL